MKILSVVGLAVLILMGISQVRGQQAPAPDAKPIVLANMDVKFKIRDVQLKQERLRSEYNDLIKRQQDLGQQYTELQKSLAELDKQAFISANLSQDEYTFNEATLDFTKKPAPAKEKK